MISNLDLKILLPQNSNEEKTLIRDIIILNTKIKENFNDKEILKLTQLRMTTSETLEHESWFKSLKYLEDQYKLSHDQLILTEKLIRKTNEILTGNIQLRNKVVVAGSQFFPDPAFVEKMFFEFCNIICSIDNPISKAAFTYQAICTIHPFIDGNGRTGRLIADYILIYYGYAPLIFPTSVSAFVIPKKDELNPHLCALQKIKDSTEWMIKLFPKDL